MRARRQSKRGRSARSGGDTGEDLFSQTLAGAVKTAFEAGTQQAGSAGSPQHSDPPGVVDKNVAAAETLAHEGKEVSETVGAEVVTAGDGGDGHPNTLAVEGKEGDEVKEQRGWKDSGGQESPLSVTEGGAVDPIPARMLNEFVYCRRLFYYEYVEGVFVESADTVRGAVIHRRVDKGRGNLPPGEDGKVKKGKVKSPNDGNLSAAEVSGKEVDGKGASEGEMIHSKSVMLGSERLGVVAKMDLVEVTLDREGGVSKVCPVDYKVGSPREGANEESELWDTDRMQLGLQCLVLRDNGYACDAGIIYYRGTKQRVPLEITPELEAWVIAQIAAARTCAAGTIPPPLCDSPKCARCSLAPVCLPDETRMLSIPTIEKHPLEDIGVGTSLSPDVTFAPSEEHSLDEGGGARVSRGHAEADSRRGGAQVEREPRRLMAPRDEKRALYLTTQGHRVSCNDAVLKVKEKDRVVQEFRLMDLCHVALFGNIQVSTQAVQRLCDQDIPVTYFSMGGWFYGITRGHSLKNVLLRVAQFRTAADPAACLKLAQQFVRGKIHNQRVMFMRNHEAPPERTKLRLGQAREDALATKAIDGLLGVEGAAAREYFAQFGGMLRQREDEDYLEGLTPAAPTNADTLAQFRFEFAKRNRRPPTDPVNALLSLAYSMLAKECTLAAYAVGLDPYVGFYHQPRHGRPALALDLMEEFRPLIAESAVITAINNRFVTSTDFVSAGEAVNLSATGRKQFFQCFEQRINGLITHPVFDYKVSYRRALELQFRILARVLTGEIPEYVPFLTR
ncbi:MAG TPA: CRISPR-associated endonuclease Cas1 [Chthoniobacter sp.]|jgi:CRISPR-associated protein Cas1